MGKTQKSIERIRNIGHILKFNTLTANPKCKLLLNALKSQEWENSQYDLYIIPIFVRLCFEDDFIHSQCINKGLTFNVLFLPHIELEIPFTNVLRG